MKKRLNFTRMLCILFLAFSVQNNFAKAVAVNGTTAEPSSNGSGVFKRNSSNTAVTTISSSKVPIVDAGSSIITATQTAAEGYSTKSVATDLEDALVATAPTVANISYCKGAKAVALTATATGTNVLKWYSTATIATALRAAPTPLTTTVGIKSYYVAQVASDGSTSPRAEIVVTVNAILAAPGTITGTGAQGPLVGTETTATYSIVAVDGADSYLWTVPLGVNIVNGQGTTSVTVNFKDVLAGAGAIGKIGVAAVTAAGCGGAAKTLALTKALPAAPAAIKMTDASLPIPVSGIATAITSFAQYMEPDKVLILTAKPVIGATSYDWELPRGVNIRNNSATTVDGVTSSTSNEITIDFRNVTRADYFTYDTTAATPVQTNVLRIGVKARNGVGVSTTANATAVNPATTSTAKLLTLTAVAPAAVSKIVMTNDAVSTTAAVTSVSTFVDSGTVLTLTAAPSALASSYHWNLPNGVNRISPDESANTNVIQVMFNGDTFGATTFYIGVLARNGVGASSTRNVAPAPLDQWKYLKLTAAAPAAPGATTGTLAICKTKESSVTYTITAAAKDALYYNVTAPAGCTLNYSYDNSIRVRAKANATFTVNYPAGFTANTTTSIKTITIQSVNGVGVNTTATNKVLKLTNIGAVCPTDPDLFRRAAPKAIATVSATEVYPNPVSNDFNIELTAAKAGVLEIAIYSLDNNLIVNPKNVKLQEGVNVLNENVSSLNSGIYIVKLINASTGEVITKKLVKN